MAGHDDGREMKIAAIGKGNIGGGLADLWEKAGHDVTRIGHEGGDVGDADAVLVAVPGGTMKEALAGVSGLDGKTVIDATNLYGGAEAPDGFASNAEYVKSVTGGPTAKAWNINFAALFDQVAAASTRPDNLWCGDEGARAVVEQLNADAGYAPVYVGDLSKAAVQEGFLGLVMTITREAAWARSSTGSPRPTGSSAQPPTLGSLWVTNVRGWGAQRSIAEPIVTVRSAGRWKKSAGLAALRAIAT